MNQLFENFTRGIDMWRPPFVEPFFGDFQIKLDIKDNDNQIIVNAEIPGVEQKDIEVLLTDETLSIKGEKKEQKEEQDKGYYRAERSYGSFQRMIPLPCAVERDHVDATFKNGILTIVLPKSKKPLNSAKKIEFKNT
jgi:HSP20 family protein